MISFTDIQILMFENFFQTYNISKENWWSIFWGIVRWSWLPGGKAKWIHMQVSLFVRVKIDNLFESCYCFSLCFYLLIDWFTTPRRFFIDIIFCGLGEDICIDTFFLHFRFPLGTQQQVCRYIQQFKEIFTEDWRKSVKITHRVCNSSISYISFQWHIHFLMEVTLFFGKLYIPDDCWTSVGGRTSSTLHIHAWDLQEGYCWLSQTVRCTAAWPAADSSANTATTNTAGTTATTTAAANATGLGNFFYDWISLLGFLYKYLIFCFLFFTITCVCLFHI